VGISTYHQWQQKAKYGSLENEKPVPKRRPKTTPPQEIAQALNLSLTHQSWGGQKLSDYLLVNKVCYLSPSTAARLKKKAKEFLDEHNLKLVMNYEFINANDAWALDFLEFKWGVHTLYVLPIVDDCSRYVLNWTVTTNPTVELVKELLKETFLLHGLPKVIKTDNGPQFRQELAGFLQALGVEHYPSPYRTPTFNGKAERLNLDLRDVVEKAAQAETIEECITIIGRTFYEHNYVRPHQALDGITPYQRYSGFEERIKAQIKRFKEQELHRKELLAKRALWVPGRPDPQYRPKKIIVPGQPKNNLIGLIVPVKSRNNRGKIIGFVRQSLAV